MRNLSPYRGSRLPGGRLVFGIVLAAFLLRALLPVGYMPSFGGGVFIEICTPQGIEYLAFGPDGLPLTDPQDGHSAAVEHPCPFGLVSAASVLGTETAPLAAPHVFASHVFATRPAPRLHAAPAQDHRPRAPPVLS